VLSFPDQRRREPPDTKNHSQRGQNAIGPPEGPYDGLIGTANEVGKWNFAPSSPSEFNEAGLPGRVPGSKVWDTCDYIAGLLGPGLLENAYKACLAHELRLAGHEALREVHLDITYKGLCVENAYIMDIVVDHKVVVEAKAIAKFSDADFAQLNSCLHFANFEVGLLINFHNWPLKDGGIKRLVNTKP